MWFYLKNNKNPRVKICFYNEGVDIELSKIASFIEKETGLDVEIKESLIKSSVESNGYNPEPQTSESKSQINIDELALGFAKAKVCFLNKDIENQPLKQEIEYEKKRLQLYQFTFKSNSKRRGATTEGELVLKEKSGLFYDGIRLQEIFRSQLPKQEISLNYAHIIFTKELFATYDEGNKRYHLRVSVYGFPSLISTSGIIEAPAKPREYYIKKHLGIADEKLNEEFKERFIDYNSPCLPEILKGYILQAIFFHITGFPFCRDKNCRLYNAHWQEEVINSQLKSGRLCEKHTKLLYKMCHRG